MIEPPENHPVRGWYRDLEVAIKALDEINARIEAVLRSKRGPKPPQTPKPEKP